MEVLQGLQLHVKIFQDYLHVQLQVLLKLLVELIPTKVQEQLVFVVLGLMQLIFILME